jgi:hypothetical protein
MRHLSAIALVLGCAIVAGVSAFLTQHAMTRGAAVVTVADSVIFTPTAGRRELEKTTELVVVFLVSSTCGASKIEGLPEALKRIREVLAVRSTHERKRFSMIGASLDEDPSAGLSFLRKYGPFDQVVAGGSWHGLGSVIWISRDMPGPFALPQLLVFEREVLTSNGEIRVGPDRLLARRVGGDQILRLASALTTADSY